MWEKQVVQSDQECITHSLSEKTQGQQNHPSVQTLYRQGAFCQRSEILNIGMVYSKIQHTQS